jgi:sterol desaturase/sphingolipid hydroxylase (fatty acid hydroxylase superfamily)
MKSVAGFLFVMVSLSLFFALLEWKWGRVRQRFFSRPALGTDLSYWVLSPLVTDWITRIALIVTIVPLALLVGVSLSSFKNYTGFGPVSRWPVVLQSVLMLVLSDFLSYWMHRLFHRGRLWPFHAVHHSATHLDWLAAARVHPVNDVLTKVAIVAPLFLLGFSPKAAVYVPVATLYALLLHTSLPWTYGPLRFVVASPVFHRWHHSREPAAIDKNFAGFLPVWDLMFGTFYMPTGKLPEDLGVAGDPVPTGLWGQLKYPFKAGRSST